MQVRQINCSYCCGKCLQGVWIGGGELLYKLIVGVTVICEKQEGGVISLESSTSESFFM